MRILFLDDDERRIDVWKKHFPGSTITCTSDETIEQLRDHGPWDIISLDHDLGGMQMVSDDEGYDTGMQVIYWIEQNKPEFRYFFIHSYNFHAAPIMADVLNRMGYEGMRIPFGNQHFQIVQSVVEEYEGWIGYYEKMI